MSLRVTVVINTPWPLTFPSERLNVCRTCSSFVYPCSFIKYHLELSRRCRDHLPVSHLRFYDKNHKIEVNGANDFSLVKQGCFSRELLCRLEAFMLGFP